MIGVVVIVVMMNYDDGHYILGIAVVMRVMSLILVAVVMILVMKSTCTFTP